MFFIFKIIISGLIVALVSTIAKRSPSVGALVVSLPIISLLGVMWLYMETRDTEKIAAHLSSTFWYVLPSLPLFLIMPYMLRHGVSFIVALTFNVVLTILLYFAMILVLRRFGTAI